MTQYHGPNLERKDPVLKEGEKCLIFMMDLVHLLIHILSL